MHTKHIYVIQTCLTNTLDSLLPSAHEMLRCRGEESSMVCLLGINMLVFVLENVTVNLKVSFSCFELSYFP